MSTQHAEAMEFIESVARELRTLARGFGITGNIIVRDQLMDASDSLAEAVEAARKAERELFYEHFARVQETSGLLLKATLAGCIIARKAADPDDDVSFLSDLMSDGGTP